LNKRAQFDLFPLPLQLANLRMDGHCVFARRAVDATRNMCPDCEATRGTSTPHLTGRDEDRHKSCSVNVTGFIASDTFERK
jgi:hypothetical protein